MQEQQIIQLGRRTPDYTGDRYWAKLLATKIQKYHQDRGYHNVRVWVEQEDKEGRKIWNIRSNIKYTVPS